MGTHSGRAEPLAPPGTFEARVRRVVESLSELGNGGSGAGVISSLANCRYLTNFSGSNALLVLTYGATTELNLITDGRYLEQAQEELADLLNSGTVHARILDQAGKHAYRLAGELASGRGAVFCEHAVVTHRDYNTLQSALNDSVSPLDCSGAVNKHRRVKDAHEVELLSVAASISDAAFAAVAPMIEDGVEELEIAAELNARMMSLGAAGPAFQTIIGSGPNGALPHAHPTSREVRGGETVVIDFGAEFAGYRSDCTRTIFVGGEAGDADAGRAYLAVLESQRAGIDALADGVLAMTIDDACRAALPGELASRFTHATGHAIGLEVHEEPILRAESDALLRSGMVVTVEPGVYLPGRFGIRIEDTLLIEGTGSRPLTCLPK